MATLQSILRGPILELQSQYSSVGVNVCTDASGEIEGKVHFSATAQSRESAARDQEMNPTKKPRFSQRGGHRSSRPVCSYSQSLAATEKVNSGAISKSQSPDLQTPAKNRRKLDEKWPRRRCRHFAGRWRLSEPYYIFPSAQPELIEANVATKPGQVQGLTND